MTPTRYKIVFDGELMPEVALEAAQENLARLFKSDPARISKLFSGSTVAIKRDLHEHEADQYLAALHRAGAKARKEPEQSAGLSLVESADHPPASAGASAEPAASVPDSMDCPKCGQRQARAAECAACGIIIDKFIARQAQQAPAPHMAASSAANSPYATPQSAVAEALPEYGDLEVFSLEGRIGRLRYLAWSLVLMLAGLALMGVASMGFAISELVGGILLVLVALAMIVVSVQIGAQRLHDIGWSGWLWLLNLVPLVGGVLALLLLVVPGSSAANRFGPPPPPNSRAVKLLAWLWLLVPILGIVAAISIPAYQDYMQRAGL